MFNQPLEFRFVQKNANRFGRFAYDYEYIYKFFYQDIYRKNRRKYIVEVKQYSQLHFRIDFYSPLSSKEKDTRNQEISKYRYTTNAGGVNRIAVTIFAILGSLRKQFPDMSFGLQAASLLEERTDHENKRFRAYQKILASVTGASQNFWQVFAYPEDSYIFVIQSRFSAQKMQIIEEYGRIFGKIFAEQEDETESYRGRSNRAGGQRYFSEGDS